MQIIDSIIAFLLTFVPGVLYCYVTHREVKQMKLWVDDVRPAPEGYVWCRTVYDAINMIQIAEKGQYDPFDNYHPWNIIPVIDIDHDAGDYAQYGGDYIRLLDWLEETGRNYPIRIHSANPVGVANMRAIIQKNGWKEVF